jgi:hypothetical protein
MPGIPVKMKNSQTSRKPPPHSTKKNLDTVSSPGSDPAKKMRGRPPQTPNGWVTGRAANYQLQLTEVWKRLGAPLLDAKTADGVTDVFKEFAEPYAGEFVPRLSSDILSLLQDPDFPKRTRPRIKFLAHSLAGRPLRAFRTSRDICEKTARQEKLKSPHKILRREFYIECSCGYQGPARDNGCRKCGAQAPPSLYEWTGQAPSDQPTRQAKKPSGKIDQKVQAGLPPVTSRRQTLTTKGE